MPVDQKRLSDLCIAVESVERECSNVKRRAKKAAEDEGKRAKQFQKDEVEARKSGLPSASPDASIALTKAFETASKSAAVAEKALIKMNSKLAKSEASEPADIRKLCVPAMKLAKTAADDAWNVMQKHSKLKGGMKNVDTSAVQQEAANKVCVKLVDEMNDLKIALNKLK